MRVSSIINRLVKEGRTILTEIESKKILNQIGIPAVETKLARTQKEALSICKKIGFPVVLKISTPDIIHKTDSGGVKLSINSNKEVIKAFKEILEQVKQKSPDATIQGISVQRMLPQTLEVIVGVTKDPQFGPVIMFGLGGIFVEVFKDVSFRIIPVERKDAQEMIQEIKGYPLLMGYRGREPANIPALVDIILKLSKFVEENPQVKELELNPIFAYKEKALAVDARILLE